MDENDPYAGPEIDGSEASRTALKRKLREWVGQRAEQIHVENIREWARQDHGDFPQAAQARRQARQEISLLVAGLGPWAAVDPVMLDRNAETQNKYKWPEPWEIELRRWFGS